MAKSILVSSGNFNIVPAGTSEYFEVATTSIVRRAVRTSAQVKWQSAGTFSKYTVIVTQNTHTTQSTIRFEKDGVAGNGLINIPAGQVGIFDDPTNTDTITAGQQLSYRHTTGTGGSIQICLLSAIFEPSSSTETISKLGACAQTAFTTASTTRYQPIAGELSNGVSVESSAQVKFTTAGTLRNLEVYVLSNARTTNTIIKTRKNAADGNLTVTYGNVEAGQKEDTTHTDAIAAGDLLDFAVVTSTGTQTLTLNHITAEFVTTDGKGFIVNARAGGFAQTEPLTTWPAIGGNAAIANATPEANSQVELGNAFTFSDMTISVTANTVNAVSTLTFRKNGANGNQTVSIPSTGTGFITDTTNSDVCTAGDLVNMQLVTPDVTGTQTMTVRNFTLESATLTSVSQASIQKYDIDQYVTGANVQKYNLLQYVTQAGIHKYNLLVNIIQGSIHKYNLLVNISQASIHKYNLSQFAIQNSIQKYNLLRYITQNSIHKYQILVNAIQTSIHKYSLLAYINQSSIQKYNLLRYITQASIQKYNILTYIVQSSIQKYSLLTNVLQSSIHKYSLLQNILQSSIQKYNVIQNILQSSIHKYNSLQNILQNTIHKYDIIVLGAVIASTIQKYNILVYVNQMSTQKYHILHDVLQSSIHTYNLLENVMQTTIHKYNLEILGAVIANTIQKYDIRQYVTQESMQKYYILNYILASSAHTYNILQYILQESIHKYDILPTIGQVVQTTIHKYNIAKYVLRTSIHKYSIGSLKRQLKSLYPGTGGIETSKGSRLLQNLLRELWPN